MVTAVRVFEALEHLVQLGAHCVAGTFVERVAQHLCPESGHTSCVRRCLLAKILVTLLRFIFVAASAAMKTCGDKAKSKDCSNFGHTHDEQRRRSFGARCTPVW